MDKSGLSSTEVLVQIIDYISEELKAYLGILSIKCLNVEEEHEIRNNHLL